MLVLIQRSHLLDTQNVYTLTVTVLRITSDTILTIGPSTFILPKLETKYDTL